MVRLTFDLISGHVILIPVLSYCCEVSLFLGIIKLNTTCDMLTASKSLFGGEYHFFLCNTERQPPKKIASAGHSAGSS